MNDFQQAYAQMSELPNGPLERSDMANAYSIIFLLWPHLEGSDETSMSPDKLYRWEEPEWNDPFLTFKIERHGGTVAGSTRADVYFWQVNVQAGIAKIIKTTYRQLRPTAKRLDVKPLAAQCSQLILSATEHAWLKWSHDGQRVQIQIGQVIPDGGNQETVTKRRKRFRSTVNELLGNDWQQVAGPHNTWERIK